MSNAVQIQFLDAPPPIEAPDTYTFELASKECKAFSTIGMKDCWLKWGLASRAVTTFRICGKRFGNDEMQAFLVDFFQSEDVRRALHLQDKRGNPTPLSGKVSDVKFEPLKCTATTMDMFEVFVANGVVTNVQDEGEDEDEDAPPLVATGGYIRRKMDEDIEGVTVSDLLKDSLLNEYSDHPVDTLIAPEVGQKELLFRLFKWVVTGGGSCQPEEYWGPYLEATKLLYKDLTTVVKDPATGELSVASVACAVRGLVGEGGGNVPLFPTDSPHHALFLVVDPIKRTVMTLYGPFLPFW